MKTPRRRQRARGSGEQGSTLLLALALIVVIGIAGAAVLNSQQTSFNVQNAYKNLRVSEVSADKMAQSVIHGLRYDQSSGIEGATGNCGGTAGTLSPLATGSSQFDVMCTPVPGMNSGKPNGDSGDAYPNTILALGGEVGPGQNSGQSPTLQDPSAWLPFCDNFHDFQSGTQAPCEASLFVGKAVGSSTDPGAGGLYIASTGSGTTAPLVRSNGSIIVSGADANDQLLVGGQIYARRQCGWGSQYSGSPPTLNSIFLPPNTGQAAPNIIADWSPNSTGGNSADLKCNREANGYPGMGFDAVGDPTSGDIPNTGAYDPGTPTSGLAADPDLPHEPIDITKLPIVDASQPLTSPYYLSPDLCVNDHHFVVMPAAPLTYQSGPNAGQPAMEQSQINGKTYNYPLYGAWYDSANDLNAMMTGPNTKCQDTIFWFRPGIYYFDFLDYPWTSPARTEWESANGCFPTTSTCSVDSLIGGSPFVPSGADGSIGGSAGATGWMQFNPCQAASDASATQPLGTTVSEPTVAQIQNCQQPARLMVPSKATYGGQPNYWSDCDGNPPPGNPGNNFTIANAPNDNGEAIDNNVACDAIWGAGGPAPNQNANVTDDWFQSPIPQDSSATGGLTTINKLQIEVAYNLVKPSGYTDAATWANPPNDNMPNGTDPGAEIDVSIGNGSHCYIHLPTGNHSYVTTGAPPLHALASTSGVANTDEVINLSDGCDAHTIESSAPDVTVEHATTGMPQGPIGDPLNTDSVGNPLGNGDYLWKHPDWLNGIKVEFSAKANGALPYTSAATAQLDGIQVNVAWKGRPAPSFPGGCDDRLAGVQFLMGSRARINWGDYSSSDPDMYSELCASAPKYFPNWDNDPACSSTPPSGLLPCYQTDTTNDADNLPIAIYGMTEDSAGPPQAITTDEPGALPLSLVTADTQWPPPPAVSSPPADASAFTKIGDGSAQKLWWSGTNPATLSFTTSSNLVCPWTESQPSGTASSCNPNQIPAGSYITSVDLEVAHNEGWATSNGGAPSACNADPGIGSHMCANAFKVNISPGPGLGGLGNKGSDGYSQSDGIGAWNSSSSSNGGILEGDINAPTQGYDVCTPSLQNATGYCDKDWGNRSGLLQNNVFPTWSPAPQFNENLTPNADWSIENNLTQDLHSPEALAGAEITVSVTPTNDGYWHYEALDGLVLRITYRPPFSPRPLSGCSTTRVGALHPPVYYEGLGSAGATPDWQWNPATYQYTGLYNGGGHDWLDSDWGPLQSTGSLNGGGPQQGDQGFGNNSGTGGSNGSVADKQDCALVDVYSSNGSSGSLNKIHVAGMIYAPSAAVQLAGRDNDAPWVTAGLVARQITALRWKGANGVPALGDTTPDHNDRFIEIDICKKNSGCSTGNDYLREYVQFVDSNGLDLGGSVKIYSYTRNPSS
jgi:hypothetical protein